ncbi:MAG: 50S ribosomal protein L4 [Thermoguttaceae bacterium]|jgi:large subunit ribosomal protein L4|nr:50S ribosomal protein L4 [Thermoguttaceae bacterium]
MVSLPVYDRTGAEVGQVEIDPAQLAPRISKQLMHDAVVMYEANLRQGSAKTKSRSEVSGTTKKMYRQKGTGNARAGSRRSGVRRGGGHIFAIRPRDYHYRLPKKAVRLATRMAVASRIADDEITLIDELRFIEPKTRDMAAILKALGIEGQTLLVAIEEHDPNVHMSVRNLPGVKILPVSDLNALDVLRPRRLLMTRSALVAFRDRAAANGGVQGSPAQESEPGTSAGAHDGGTE